MSGSLSNPGSAVIVTGATSQIGRFLVPRLLDCSYAVHAWSRRPAPANALSHPALHWRQCDITRDSIACSNAATLIHLAPVWLLPEPISTFAAHGIRRIVAFSSTSRFSKLHSTASQEQQVVSQLIAAEEAIATRCAASGISWTLFRPTLVYGCGLDKNVAAIAAFIRRYGFFPLAGEGCGLRQPVHADDLAAACLAVLQCQASDGQAYNVSGGETLTYRAMVERIFQALRQQPRIIKIPPALFALMIRAIALLPSQRHLGHEMVLRINRDLCFDHAPATRDFGFAPRGFAVTESELVKPA